MACTPFSPSFLSPLVFFSLPLPLATFLTPKPHLFLPTAHSPPRTPDDTLVTHLPALLYIACSRTVHEEQRCRCDSDPWSLSSSAAPHSSPIYPTAIAITFETHAHVVRGPTIVPVHPGVPTSASRAAGECVGTASYLRQRRRVTEPCRH